MMTFKIKPEYCCPDCVHSDDDGNPVTCLECYNCKSQDGPRFFKSKEKQDMQDLIADLRKYARAFEATGNENSHLYKMISSAADSLERLMNKR